MRIFQNIEQKHLSGSNVNIQPALEIGKEDDEYEKEANTVADKVMKMNDDEDGIRMKDNSSGISMMSDEEERLQMKSDEDDRIQMMNDDDDEDEKTTEGGEKVQMMVDSPLKISKMGDSSEGVLKAPLNVEQGINNSKGHGQPLNKDLQNELGDKMNADFSKVKLHTDENAVHMNKEIGAKAFTHGNDIYFNSGQYNSTSDKGKHLLAHELTHTVQQKGVNAEKVVQRVFEPEDASAEMVGKKFKTNLDQTLKKGTVKMPKGTVIVITSWDNAETHVTAKTKINNVTYSFYIDKVLLDPVGDDISGLAQYSADVEGQQETVNTGKQDLKDYEKTKGEYEKLGSLDRYNKEHQRIENLQKNRYELLNRRLIQETMYNSMDASIKKWVDYYNTEIGVPNKWDKLDANLIKSMIFQESQMGTAGKFLLNTRYEGDPMTRFNVTQAVDSSGSILTLMMSEMDPTLAAEYKIKDVTTDLYAAQKRYKELKKLNTLKPAEDLELQEINRRAPDTEKSKLWDNFYWTDSRFYNAWLEFNKQPEDKERVNDYDFWIRAGIRWVFKKREKVTSWEDAIKAYNGTDNAQYKKDVVDRSNSAKASKGKFIPKEHYY